MAVINCASCGKKISDKAKTCGHCGLDLTGVDKNALSALATANRIKKSQALMNQSFVAMLLFCGGFLMLYMHNEEPDGWRYQVAVVSTVLGFILYIVNRVRLVILKHKSGKA